MIEGLRISTSRIALALVAGFAFGGAFAAPAQAADLGGDCCADLEERVAELEATTVRKGNRKVSVKLYGQVNKAVMFWDDGDESNTYVVDNNHSATRFGFKGKAKIGHGWSAGYRIEIETDAGTASNELDADNDNANAALSVRHSFMYIKSKTYGAINIGTTSGATDDITYKGQVSGNVAFSQADWHYNQDFRIKLANGASSGIDVGQLCSDIFDSDGCFDTTSRQNVVRYDSPKVAGFQVKAAWGDDDFWDVGLYYKGSAGDFKYKANVGYRRADQFDNATTSASEDKIFASGGIKHKPTGLFVEGSYVYAEFDSEHTDATLRAAQNSLDTTAFWISAGIQQKWNSLGKTTIWGEYANAEDGHFGQCEGAAVTFSGTRCDLIDSEVDRWGVGISQNIDAAAMKIYAKYEHSEFEFVENGVALDLQDFDLFVMGGIIKF